MNKFNKVLDVEEKYDNILNDAKNNSEKELDKFKSSLNKKEKAQKKEIKESFDNELKFKKEELENEGLNLVETAKSRANEIELKVDKNNAIQYLLNEFKEVNL